MPSTTASKLSQQEASKLSFSSMKISQLLAAATFAALWLLALPNAMDPGAVAATTTTTFHGSSTSHPHEHHNGPSPPFQWTNKMIHLTGEKNDVEEEVEEDVHGLFDAGDLDQDGLMKSEKKSFHTSSLDTVEEVQDGFLKVEKEVLGEAESFRTFPVDTVHGEVPSEEEPHEEADVEEPRASSVGVYRYLIVDTKAHTGACMRVLSPSLSAGFWH